MKEGDIIIIKNQIFIAFKKLQRSGGDCMDCAFFCTDRCVTNNLEFICHSKIYFKRCSEKGI